MTPLVLGSDFEVAPFDEEAHGDFVVANYSKRLHVSKLPLLKALAIGRARGLVAHIAGEPDALLGFAVTVPSPVLEQPAVWWCYVRPSQRGRRLAGQLLALAGVDTRRPVLLLARSEDAEAYARTHTALFLSTEFERIEC